MRRIWAESIEDETLDLAPEEARHLRDVLRARVGDDVRVFDGEGKERLARVESTGPRVMRLRVAGAIERSPPPRGDEVVLWMSMLKGDAMDRVIRAATELGVREVRPVIAARSIPQPKRDRAGRQTERWRRIAREAIRQSGRAWLPRIVDAAPLDSAIGEARTPRRLLLDETERARFLSEVTARGAVTIAVGPEGGWEDGERDRLGAAGFVAVGLSDATLRAETAALAAVAALRTASLKGDPGGA